MDELNRGRRTGEQFGAFEFIDDKPFDIVVIVRFLMSNEQKARQVQIYYSEHSRISSFVFDVKDPAFQFKPEAFLECAVQTLLGEVKSRVLAREEFNVWYYSGQERDTTESATGLYISRKPQMQRFLDELVKRSRIIEANSPDKG